MTTSAFGGLLMIAYCVGILVVNKVQDDRAKKRLDEQISQAMIKGDMDYAETLIKMRSNYK